jgi:hypothetical protein
MVAALVVEPRTVAEARLTQVPRHIRAVTPEAVIPTAAVAASPKGTANS